MIWSFSPANPGLHEASGAGMGRGVERWLVISAILLASIAVANAALALKQGRRSLWTPVFMVGGFAAQLAFLLSRAELHGACPLVGLSEILIFLSWSLTMFYLIVGPAYRISLLGVFTAPLVVILQLVAVFPGIWDDHPMALQGVDPWRETHAAMSVMSYGGLALAAVAGVMFLVLDRKLKEQRLSGGLFQNLPPIRELIISMKRLLWIGWTMLSVGVVAGFRMPHGEDAKIHLVSATAVWVCYAILLGVMQFRGLTGRRLSWLTVALFVASLLVLSVI